MRLADIAKLAKEHRIKQELGRLKRLLKQVPKGKLDAALGVMQRAAFMHVTLQDLEEDINAHGTVEEFTQGDNTYDRLRPAAALYNTTVKNYTTTVKQLVDLLPAGPVTTNKEMDAFQKIMNRGEQK